MSDFQFLVMLSLEASRMWVVVCLRGPGIVSMLRFRSAISGEGGIGVLLMLVSRLNASTQYFRMEGHVQKMWNMSPLDDLHRQQMLGVLVLNVASLSGVKYQRSEIFWVSSQSAEHWVAL